MTHILRNTQKTLTQAVPADVPVSGLTVTVAATRAAGTAVTLGAVTEVGATGVYQSTVDDADTATLDRLTVVWTRVATGEKFTSYAEIVGAHLFTLAELRALSLADAQTPLASTTDYPNSTLEETRERITDRFADYCGVSFIPRFARIEIPGTGQYSIEVPHRLVTSILSASISGVTQTPGDIEPIADTRLLHLTSGIWSRPTIPDPKNVTLAYEYGWASPPEDIRRAAMRLAVHELVRSGMPDRALSFTNEFGNMRLASPGVNTPTGFPEVDEVLNRHRYESVI
jgi:hypothetical protein